MVRNVEFLQSLTFLFTEIIYRYFLIFIAKLYDCDDIRFCLAVARTGTLSGAAVNLRVNHSTVFGRINQLEERVGARLFERHSEGNSLTVTGEAMRGFGERIEEEMQVLDQSGTKPMNKIEN